MTSVQYTSRRDKTDVILGRPCLVKSEELLEDHCCNSISYGLGDILKNVRYIVRMVYLVGLIRVEQRNFCFSRSKCAYIRSSCFQI